MGYIRQLGKLPRSLNAILLKIQPLKCIKALRWPRLCSTSRQADPNPLNESFSLTISTLPPACFHLLYTVSDGTALARRLLISAETSCRTLASSSVIMQLFPRVLTGLIRTLLKANHHKWVTGLALIWNRNGL